MSNISVPGNISGPDFNYIDYVNEARFDQFDLFGGDNFAFDPFLDFSEHNCYGDSCSSHYFMPTQDQNVVIDIDHDHANDGEQSRVSSTPVPTTTTITTTKSNKKADRSKTIVSERRRRGRMKEKLYALRALVPNITKMDKASIIEDAVMYMQDLKMQAKKLKTEIALLESSTATEPPIIYQQRPSQNVNRMNLLNTPQVIKKIILQIDVFQVEERGFYVRLVCNKGLGVAVSLYKTLESFSNFNVQNSNLNTAVAEIESYILTFTLNVTECQVELNLPNLKLWIARAFLNQGFEFVTTA